MICFKLADWFEFSWLISASLWHGQSQSQGTLKQTLETHILSVSPFSSSCHLCPGVPSAPRNVVSVVNQTSVLLEWHPPRDTGHRDDLSYNVLCRRCHSNERRACQPCDDSVAFVPGKRGLKDTRVEISKLRAHTSYTFDILVGPQRNRCLSKALFFPGMCFIHHAVLLKENCSESLSFEHQRLTTSA